MYVLTIVTLFVLALSSVAFAAYPVTGTVNDGAVGADDHIVKAYYSHDPDNFTNGTIGPNGESFTPNLYIVQIEEIPGHADIANENR